MEDFDEWLSIKRIQRESRLQKQDNAEQREAKRIHAQMKRLLGEPMKRNTKALIPIEERVAELDKERPDIREKIRMEEEQRINKLIFDHPLVFKNYGMHLMKPNRRELDKYIKLHYNSLIVDVELISSIKKLMDLLEPHQLVEAMRIMMKHDLYKIVEDVPKYSKCAKEVMVVLGNATKVESIKPIG